MPIEKVAARWLHFDDDPMVQEAASEGLAA